MKNSISTQIYNHLEFLGYEVKDLSTDDDLDIILGKHDEKNNLVLRMTKTNTLLVSISLRLSKSNKVIDEKFLNVLNYVNSKSFFSKWYYEEDEDKQINLCIEEIVLDYTYTRKSFSKILDSLAGEVSEYTENFLEFSD